MSVTYIRRLTKNGHYLDDQKSRLDYGYNGYHRHAVRIDFDWYKPNPANHNGRRRWGILEGSPDDIQPIFGYFAGGGWDMGTITNRHYRFMPKAYDMYKDQSEEHIQKYGKDTTKLLTLTLPVREMIGTGEYEQVLTPIGDYVDGAEILKPDEYAITITVGPGGDLPFFEDLRPTDKATWKHDRDLRDLEQKLFNAQESNTAYDMSAHWAKYHEINKELADKLPGLTRDLEHELQEVKSSDLPPDEKIAHLTLVLRELAIVDYMELVGFGTREGGPVSWESFQKFLKGREAVLRDRIEASGGFSQLEEEHFVAELTGNEFTVKFGGFLGKHFGSQLGNYLVQGEEFGSRLAQGFLNSIGAELGEVLGATLITGNISGAIDGVIETVSGAFTGNFKANLLNAASGTISAMLSLELGNVLGVDGFGGELLNTLNSTVIGTAVDAAFDAGANVLADFSSGELFTKIGKNLPGAMASALGSGLIKCSI